MSIIEKTNSKERRKSVRLEEKIILFEEFNSTGEKLTGQTIYKGYPIGQWAIQMRSVLKAEKLGKKSNRLSNITEEQLDRLEKCGALERIIDSNIEEKIDFLINWCKKYPFIKVTSVKMPYDTIKKYAKTPEEYEEMIKTFKRVQADYKYLVGRRSQNKLTKDMFEKCKANNVGGIFGYSKQIEELALKYKIDETIIFKVLNEYETVENFFHKYKNDEIRLQYFKDIASQMFKRVFNISDNDDKYDSIIYDRFLENDSKFSIIFYSKQDVESIIENELTEKQKEFTRILYSDKKEDNLNIKEIADKMGLTKERGRQLKLSSERRIAWNVRTLKLDEYLRLLKLEDEEILNNESKDLINEFNRLIDAMCLIGDRNTVNDCFKFFADNKRELDEIVQKNNDYKNYLKRKDILNSKIDELSEEGYNRLTELGIKKLNRLAECSFDDLINMGFSKDDTYAIRYSLEYYDLIPIENEILSQSFYNLGLSYYNINALKKIGINYLKDLTDVTHDVIVENHSISNNGMIQILEEMDKYNLFFADEYDLQKNHSVIIKDLFSETTLKDDVKIEDAGFSFSTQCILKEAGINTINDILSLDTYTLMRINDIGTRSFHEIVKKVSDMQKSYEQKIDEELKTEKEKNPDIYNLHLSLRIYNCLKRNGINTYKDLTNCSKSDLLKFKNLGNEMVNEIEKKLSEFDLNLRTEEFEIIKENNLEEEQER